MTDSTMSITTTDADLVSPEPPESAFGELRVQVEVSYAHDGDAA
ncbi:hypothetical protein [Nocardia sp. NPDC058666]